MRQCKIGLKRWVAQITSINLKYPRSLFSLWDAIHMAKNKDTEIDSVIIGHPIADNRVSSNIDNKSNTDFDATDFDGFIG